MIILFFSLKQDDYIVGFVKTRWSYCYFNLNKLIILLFSLKWYPLTTCGTICIIPTYIIKDRIHEDEANPCIYKIKKCRTYCYITNHFFLIAIIIHTFLAHFYQRAMKTFVVILGPLYVMKVYSPSTFLKVQFSNQQFLFSMYINIVLINGCFPNGPVICPRLVIMT